MGLLVNAVRARRRRLAASLGQPGPLGAVRMAGQVTMGEAVEFVRMESRDGRLAQRVPVVGRAPAMTANRRTA